MYNRYFPFSMASSVAAEAGIGSFGKVGLDYVIVTIQSHITYKLNLNLAITKFNHVKYCNILKFDAIERYSEYNIVSIAGFVVKYHDIIDEIIAIQIKVVYHRIGVVQICFKIFECFGVLKEVHHCKKIQIITR